MVATTLCLDFPHTYNNGYIEFKSNPTHSNGYTSPQFRLPAHIAGKFIKLKKVKYIIAGGGYTDPSTTQTCFKAIMKFGESVVESNVTFVRPYGTTNTTVARGADGILIPYSTTESEINSCSSGFFIPKDSPILTIDIYAQQDLTASHAFTALTFWFEVAM